MIGATPPNSIAEHQPAVDSAHEIARLRAIIEQGSEVIVVTDAQTHLVYANAYAETLLGVRRDDVIGTPVLDLLHPDDLAEAVAALGGTVTSGGVKEPFEARVRHASGAWVKFEIIATNLLEDPDVNGLVFHCRELSDRTASERRYRLLHENAPFPVALVPIDGTEIHANRAFANIFATTMSSLARKSFETLLSPRSRTDALAAMRAAMAGTNGSDPIECYAQRDDGSEFLARLKGHALRDEQGLAQGYIVGIEDITQTAAAANELAASQARLNALVNNSADIIAILYPDGNWEASDAGTRHLGYPKGFDPDGGIFSLVHPDDLETAAVGLGAVLAGTRGPDEPVELRLRAADGSYWDFECVGQNLGDLGAVGGVVVTARNVTPRKRIDAALREAQERFRAAFEHAPLGLAVLSLDGQISEFNPSGHAMLGIDSTITAQHPFFDDFVHQDDRRLFLDALRDRVEGRGGRRFEHRMTKPDGTFIWTLTDAALVSDSNGEPLHVIVMLADITERRASEQQLAFSATHDALTGLLNRSAFSDRLEHALARRHEPGSVALLFLDLDRFKAVNDTYGHQAGDTLLGEIALRLLRATREGDTVARLGGDEFVVLCEDLHSPEEATDVARRIAELVEQPVATGNNTATVGASIGIAIADGTLSSEVLMRNADAAVYRAKQRGRSRIEIFDEELSAAHTSRRSLELGLRHAIEERQVDIAYVPIVGLIDRRPHGFQAVATWTDRESVVLERDNLARTASQLGLAAVLDRLVLTTGCLEATRWRATPVGSTPMLHVPLSARHLDDSDLLNGVRSVLIGTSLNPDRVCIEVPESWVMHDPEVAQASLLGLRELGVSIALGDFGRNSSSLAMLRALPLDMVKLARPFFIDVGRDRAGQAVVAAVIAMARSLDLVIIADGAHSIGDVRALVNFDCDLGQGQYFGEALSADAAQAYAQQFSIAA